MTSGAGTERADPAEVAEQLRAVLAAVDDGQGLRQLDQVVHRSAQPVQPGDDQHVAGTQVGERGVELRAPGQLAVARSMKICAQPASRSASGTVTRQIL